jgi:hypothetical protein
MGPSQGQPRILCIHSAAEARTARALAGPTGEGAALRFLSAPGAASYLGAAGFRAILGEEWPQAILDCGDAPGRALEALRLGCPAVVLAPHVPAFAALVGIAAAQGAVLLPARPPHLDLARVDLGKPAGLAYLRRFLAGSGEGPHLHHSPDMP